MAHCPHVLPEVGHLLHELWHVTGPKGDLVHLHVVLGVLVLAGRELGRGGDTLILDQALLRGRALAVDSLLRVLGLWTMKPVAGVLVPVTLDDVERKK